MHKTLIYLVSEDWYFLSHRLSLAKTAMDRGYVVHVICKNTGLINNIKKYGFKCHELKSKRSNISIMSIFKEILNVRLLIKNIDPAIVHLVAIRPILLGLTSLLFKKISK